MTRVVVAWPQSSVSSWWGGASSQQLPPGRRGMHSDKHDQKEREGVMDCEGEVVNKMTEERRRRASAVSVVGSHCRRSWCWEGMEESGRGRVRWE
jgi:hypothetical protein